MDVGADWSHWSRLATGVLPTRERDVQRGPKTRGFPFDKDH